MHNPRPVVPKLWFSPSACEPTTCQGQCECPGDACSYAASSDGNSIPVDMFARQLKMGTVRDINLDRDVFSSCIGEQTLALGAKGQGVVVLDAEAGRLLPSWGPSALNDLRSQVPEWPIEMFEHTIALLLALNVLSSPQIRYADAAQQKSKTLIAWLHLTNQCNLSCQHCFVTQSSQQMDVFTAQRAVDAVYRSALAHDHAQIRLKYAGGEPTLNFSALRGAQRRAEVLSEQTGIALEAVILTNGVYLTDAQIDTLLKHNIRAVVSLDGVGRYQDMQRPLAGGDGSSFEYVDHTLDRLLARGISPHISITITGPSISGLPELVEYLLDQRLRFSFNFYRDPDWSPVPDASTFTPDRMIEGLQLAFQVIERRLPEYSLLSSLSDRADLRMPHLRACGVGQNYIVIDCDGSVSKCQMGMECPITTIDADDPLALVRADTNGIQNLAADQKECRECVWRYRCTGGCPRLTFQRTGRYNAKSPLCEVYQAILPEVVRLEALRLLKYEEPWDFCFPVN